MESPATALEQFETAVILHSRKSVFFSIVALPSQHPVAAFHCESKAYCNSNNPLVKPWKSQDSAAVPCVLRQNAEVRPSLCIQNELTIMLRDIQASENLNETVQIGLGPSCHCSLLFKGTAKKCCSNLANLHCLKSPYSVFPICRERFQTYKAISIWLEITLADIVYN